MRGREGLGKRYAGVTSVNYDALLFYFTNAVLCGVFSFSCSHRRIVHLILLHCGDRFLVGLEYPATDPLPIRRKMSLISCGFVGGGIK